MLLPLIGAGLGGYEAYRRSGGNLGATALGAGVGALAPVGLRMAGTAIGAKLAGTPLAARASTGLMGAAADLSKVAASRAGTLRGGLAAQAAAQAAKGAGKLTDPTALPKALGGLAAGTGVFLGAPSLAGGLAAGLAPAASNVAGGALNLGTQALQPGQAVYDAGGAVPTNVPVGASPYGVLDIYNLAGPFAANRANELLTQDVQLAGLRKIMPELFKAAEARSKTEFQRQMAAAGIRQNIATAANMLERSQQAAQQMGLNAAQQMGSALTSQYQYQ